MLTKHRYFPLALYAVVWCICVGSGWIFVHGDAMGYGLLVFFLFLPLAAIVSSLLMGLHRSWNRSTWLFPLIPAAGHMLADYLTFKLANSISHHKCNLPDWNLLIPGLVCAVIGLLIGIAVARISK